MIWLKMISNPRVLIGLLCSALLVGSYLLGSSNATTACELKYEKREGDLLKGLAKRRMENEEKMQVLTEALDRERGRANEVIYKTRIERIPADAPSCGIPDIIRLQNTRTRSINLFAEQPE